jgi:hypothetical protein
METLREFLDRRERELTHQVAAVRQDLTTKEGELAEIKAAKAALPPVLHPVESHSGGVANLESVTTVGVAARANLGGVAGLAAHATVIPGPNYDEMTIKQLAVLALETHYPNGATLAALREFIKDAYRRAIEPSSFRPQLHRLKADSVVTHDPSTDTWNLTPEKRRHYSMYDHPTSMAAMKELKDDEIPDNEPVTRLRDVEPDQKEKPKPTGFGVFKKKKGDDIFE